MPIIADMRDNCVTTSSSALNFKLSEIDRHDRVWSWSHGLETDNTFEMHSSSSESTVTSDLWSTECSLTDDGLIECMILEEGKLRRAVATRI